MGYDWLTLLKRGDKKMNETVVLDAAGWDNGFDSDKFTIGEDIKKEHLVFPSIAFIPEQSSINLLSRNERFDKDKMILSFNGNEYFVGNYAMKQIPRDFKKDLDQDKFKKETETVKLLAGLSSFFPGAKEIVIKNLQVGLSIGSFNKYKDDLIAKYQGKTFEYMILSDGREIKIRLHIKNVEAYPQGIAAYFSRVLNWQGRASKSNLLNRRYILVDIGGNSTDAFIAEGQEIVRGTAVALDRGTTDAYKNIKSMKGNDISVLKIEEAYKEAQNDEEIEKIIVFDNYETYDITEETERAFKGLAEYIYNQLNSHWSRHIGTERYAFSCGGGTISTGKYLDRLYPDALEHQMIDNPQFANSDGLYKIGKFKYNRVVDINEKRKRG